MDLEFLIWVLGLRKIPGSPPHIPYRLWAWKSSDLFPSIKALGHKNSNLSPLYRLWNL